jgi:hypothetical protein
MVSGADCARVRSSTLMGTKTSMKSEAAKGFLHSLLSPPPFYHEGLRMAISPGNTGHSDPLFSLWGYEYKIRSQVLTDA